MIDLRELETARVGLQRRLDAVRSQTERNRLGQFATPPELAVEIVAYALSLLPRRTKIRYLEPGFGTGAFYSALLRTESKRSIEEAAGYEIDPHYAEPARVLWGETGLRLHVGDFTNCAPPETEGSRYNLVVSNPPYVRHHHLSQAQKRELQAAVSRSHSIAMNGLSGLYAYFMVLSQAWMSREGVAAWLVPSEFMDVNYGRKIREFLTEKVTLHRIHRFDPSEVQFDDALVSSTVVCFRNAPPPDGHRAQFSFGGALSRPRVTDSIGLDALRHMGKWAGLPQALPRLVHRQNGGTLGDLFTIKRGLATGCNSFFVLRADQIQQLHLPREFLKPMLPSPREMTSNVVLAEPNGEPSIPNRRYLLSCNLSDVDVESQFPALWAYLRRGVEEGIPERYICRHRQPWYSQDKRPPAPFLCTYMGRPTRRNGCPFRFILNYSKATAANVYLMLYPEPSLAAWLAEEQDRYRRLWHALSSITADMLAREGRLYGGGLHKLEPGELANVPCSTLLSVLPRSKELKQYSQLPLFAA